MKELKKYMRRTWKNKMAALALIGVGFASIFIENDITVFVLALIIGTPLFFIKNNAIY